MGRGRCPRLGEIELRFTRQMRMSQQGKKQQAWCQDSKLWTPRELQVAERGLHVSSSGVIWRDVLFQKLWLQVMENWNQPGSDNQGKVLAHVTKKFSSSVASGEVEVTEKPVFPHLSWCPLDSASWPSSIFVTCCLDQLRSLVHFGTNHDTQGWHWGEINSTAPHGSPNEKGKGGRDVRRPGFEGDYQRILKSRGLTWLDWTWERFP